MCVFVCSKVLVTAVIDPPTAPPTSRVSHPGLLLGGRFGVNYSGVGHLQWWSWQTITSDDNNVKIIS